MITDDRRAFKRVSRKYKGRYRSVSDEPVSGDFVTDNISAGGLFFISVRSFSIGDILECSIEMPGKGEGSWKSRVVRCEEFKDGMIKTFGTAVEFIDADNDSQKKLLSSLRK